MATFPEQQVEMLEQTLNKRLNLNCTVVDSGLNTYKIKVLGPEPKLAVQRTLTSPASAVQEQRCVFVSVGKVPARPCLSASVCKLPPRRCLSAACPFQQAPISPSASSQLAIVYPMLVCRHALNSPLANPPFSVHCRCISASFDLAVSELPTRRCLTTVYLSRQTLSSQSAPSPPLSVHRMFAPASIQLDVGELPTRRCFPVWASIEIAIGEMPIRRCAPILCTARKARNLPSASCQFAAVCRCCVPFESSQPAIGGLPLRRQRADTPIHIRV